MRNFPSPGHDPTIAFPNQSAFAVRCATDLAVVCDAEVTFAAQFGRRLFPASNHD